MCHRPESDSYGDGDVPEVDTQPYKDNNFEPHPQTAGNNCTEENSKG